MLSDVQRATLLRTAREAIIRHLQPESPPLRPPGLPDPRTPASGVFVTIKRGGELRGCLGVLQIRSSLDEEIARCARDSATADPRFPPMTPEEVSDMALEISVLGPLEEIDPHDPAAIVIGRHGLVIEQGTRRGLLLPQVATEWAWDREQFLEQTCRKARLPGTAWRSGARVFRFVAEVFGERD